MSLTWNSSNIFDRINFYGVIKCYHENEHSIDLKLGNRSKNIYTSYKMNINVNEY